MRGSLRRLLHERLLACCSISSTSFGRSFVRPIWNAMHAAAVEENEVLDALTDDLQTQLATVKEGDEKVRSKTTEVRDEAKRKIDKLQELSMQEAVEKNAQADRAAVAEKVLQELRIAGGLLKGDLHSVTFVYFYIRGVDMLADHI